jgi:hypothetical protein
MAVPARATSPATMVPVTHWIAAICFFALLVAKSRLSFAFAFCWGEPSNVLTPLLFDLPIPATRSVPRGYNFILADQNGWSR